MPPSIVVIIREDPEKTPRAVEALRIALGLSTGANPLTIVLLNEAGRLLGEESDDIVDGEILEKHLPVFKELQTPFVMPEGSRSRFSVDPDFHVQESSSEAIASLVSSADRILVF